MINLHIDIETYSSYDLKKTGIYKYIEAPDFEVLMIAYAINTGPVVLIDIARGELDKHQGFLALLTNKSNTKHAHNAAFERLALNKFFGINLQASEFQCSMIKAAYCGLPLSLEKITEALKLGDKGKLGTGTALINYFSKPCKPTKANGGRTRNLPDHNLEKWEEFKRYCVNDVEAEREIGRILKPYELPASEQANYVFDQDINDRGILIDIQFAHNATRFDSLRHAELVEEIQELTSLENPNSVAQLKTWLSNQTGKDVTTLAKDAIDPLLEEFGQGAVNQVLKLRKKISKTSTKKYEAMLHCVCKDQRAHGLFQFYGANRTGRWAGRLIQLQNLPRNYLEDLDTCRNFVKDGDFEFMSMNFDNISATLSQLIRTAFIAPDGKTFAVADFSAIEARVTAWLAGEQWRTAVFNSHGKIYEASASTMFNIPIEEIGKGSDLRQKGKIAELALGYGGSVGALTTMGGEQMGLSASNMKEIVDRWRSASPNIVKLWKRLEGAAKRAMRTKKRIHVESLVFEYDGTFLTIQLPSLRKLFYYKPTFCENRFGGEGIRYRGMDQTTKQWAYVETYSGKLVENCVQAISRDLLAYSIERLTVAGFEIVMHVHDEAVAEVDKDGADLQLDAMCEIMSQGPAWSKGLPLAADGFISDYYKKD